MSNDLTLLNELGGISTQVGTSDSAYDEIAKGAEFLPRLQLFTKGKPIDRGLIAPGRYGVPVSADEVTDLGTSIDVLVLARRPKAVDMSDKDAIIAVYDQSSAEFKRIAETSMGKESNCMYGPSFLVVERSTNQFYEFFCGTKSTRAEAKKIYPFMPITAQDIEARGLTDVEPHGPLPMTLKVKLVEGKFSYHVPVAVKCSTPFTKLPTNAKIVAEIIKFVNPGPSSVEKVEEPVQEKGKRRR